MIGNRRLAQIVTTSWQPEQHESRENSKARSRKRTKHFNDIFLTSNNCSTMLATIWRRIWSGPSFCLANGFSEHIIIQWSTGVCWEQVSCDLLTWRTGFEAREGTWPRLNIRRIRKKSEQVLKSVDSGSNWFWKLTLTTCAASRSRRYENGMAEIENSIDWP